MVGEAVRFEGMVEFRRALRNVGDDLEDLKGSHGEAAKIVEDRAVQIVPFISGELQGTLRSSGTKTRGLVRAGFARTPYAGPIHFGSPKGWPPDGFGGFGSGTLRPQTFLYDALDDRHDEVLDVFWQRIYDLSVREGLDVRGRPS